MVKYNLKGKVVVITGATGGLGRELSKYLVAKKAKLVLIDLEQGALDEMVAGLGGDIAGGWAANVRDLESLGRAMEAGAAKFGRLDVVVAGAGIEVFYPTLELSTEAFERIIDVNLTGIFRTFKAAYPWIKQSKGYLLTVSSLAAFVHIPYGSGYAASKAGNYAFTNALRAELEPFGIGVGSLHPTWFDTPMVQGVKKRPAWKHLMNDDKSVLARQTSRENVAQKIVAAIEGRKETVVVPWYLESVGFLADYLRPILMWFGPSIDSRERAYAEFMKEPKL